MPISCSSSALIPRAIPSPQSSFSRRRFLRSAALLSAAAGLPIVVPSSVRGAAGRPGPNNRITVGAIGLGGQGSGNLEGFLGDQRCQVLAVNDVDRNACENARKRVNTFYNNQDCAGYKDFRELVARDDIDVIPMATPDHWHAITVMASARAGKDFTARSRSAMICERAGPWSPPSTSPKGLMKDKIRPGEINLYNSTNHIGCWRA